MERVLFLQKRNTLWNECFPNIFRNVVWVVHNGVSEVANAKLTNGFQVFITNGYKFDDVLLIFLEFIFFLPFANF